MSGINISFQKKPKRKKKNENIGKRNKNKKVQGHRVKTIYKNNNFNMPKKIN